MLSKRYAFDGKASLPLNATQLSAKEQVERKIHQGIYSFESSECIICSENQFILLAEKDRYGLSMQVVMCKTCGLIQTNPHMTQKSYNDFYNYEYRKLYVGKESATSDFFISQYYKGKQIFEYLVSNKVFEPSPNTVVLEVGCGAGGILSYFRAEGCHTIGIDVGEEYVEYGRNNHGLNLYVGTIKDINLNVVPDIVIYADVLEHILSPLNELSLLTNLISQNTHLYISMPGIKSLFWPNYSYRMDFLQLLQNAHIWHFSLTTLENMLGKQQFRLVVGDEHIRGIFKLSDAESSTYRNDYDEALKYLKRLELLKTILPISTYEIAAMRELGPTGSIRKIGEKLKFLFGK